MAKAKKEKSGSAGDNRVAKTIIKEPIPALKPGMTIRVHQRITERGPKGDKERVQVFEGMLIAHRGGKQPGATITVRKISEGVGVEKIFPLASPNVLKIEPIKQAQVRQAKLYYLRDHKKRLKETRISTN